MATCIYCGLPKVRDDEPARYDVLNPLFAPDGDPAAFGPYCADCWPSTVTAQTPPEVLA